MCAEAKQRVKQRPISQIFEVQQGPGRNYPALTATEAPDPVGDATKLIANEGAVSTAGGAPGLASIVQAEPSAFQAFETVVVGLE